MQDKINILYDEIKEKLTIEHLKKITVDIIDCYKNKNHHRFRQYLSVLKINSDINNVKSFSQLIKHYHPDKHSFILKQAEEICRKNDYNALNNLYESYFFTIDKTKTTPEINIEFDTEYAYDKNDFGYQETTIYEEEEDDFNESSLDFEYEKHGFMEAINQLFFGGLDDAMTESDLMNLDGALDLSDYEITTLSGLEHCIYIDELNLSNNNIEKIGNLSTLINLKTLYLSSNSIENIGVLENLINLKEIDISFNNISDISVLDDLRKLEYVNILGNPIKDYSIVNNLVRKGVIVIYEHTNLLFT